MPHSIALALLSASATAVAATPDYSLTIYSSAQPGSIDSEQLANYGGALPGYALVRDRRRMTLPAGVGELRFSDVAARIDPTTVSFSGLEGAAGTRVIEQNYQFDLVSGDKLLQRFLGEMIAVELQRGDQVELVRGRLLSAQGGITLELESGEIQTLNSWTGIRFPSLPGGLITRPTLVWTLQSERAGDFPVQVAYQARGLTWWADYNATLDESQGCALDLNAWVTLVNQSGGSFPDTRLKLVAGDVNRAPAAVPQRAVMKAPAMAMLDEAAAGFTESALFEYHLYTLGRRTDLPDNSTKQLELFPAVARVPCEKQLIFTAAPADRVYWGSPNLDQGYAATQTGQVGAYLQFANRKEVGLGMPLPAGRLRVNQLDRRDGSAEFVGEDVIVHTPRNERLTVKLGNAFDVVGERSQVDFKLDTTAKTLDETFEIRVRNRKEAAVKLQVREYLYRWSQWQLTAHSHAPQQRDAQTVDFAIELPADGEATVRYTVRYRW